jgi:hypothetical protein
VTTPKGGPTPLGFRILVAAAAIYLLVRLVQGVIWLAELIA